MKPTISKRLLQIVNTLPLHEGMRVLEIGCGTGIAAREITARFTNIYVLGVDRSAKAIRQSVKNCTAAITAGKAGFRQVAIENFGNIEEEGTFNLAFAIRVGALDGRHPEAALPALKNIAKALYPGGKLFIDEGDQLKEIDPNEIAKTLFTKK
jgi:SAM-dependent methyltransferase